MALTNIQPVATQKAPKAKVHLNFLDGIRALAALFVVMHHAWLFEQGIGTHSGVRGWLTNWLSYGHLAVDVFIVLSGFCLMLPVARSGQLKGGAIRFFGRRARRILPPFYAALGFSLVLQSVLLRQKHFHFDPIYRMHLPHFGSGLITNLLLLQDVLPGNNNIDPPVWTVAVEWKIYFLFPLFVVIWRRWGYAATLACAAVISCLVVGILHSVSPDLPLGHACPWYVLLFSMGLCAGALAVKQEQQNEARWRYITAALAILTAIALLAWPIAANGEGEVYLSHLPIIDALTGACTASALFLLTAKFHAAKSGPVLAFLSWRPLVFVGTFAYSIYLTHWPVLILFLSLLDHVHIPGFLVPYKLLWVNAIVFPLVIGAAYLFFLVCERPFLNSRRSDGAKHTRQETVDLQKVSSLT